MEKIQAAIAKARAIRDEQIAAEKQGLPATPEAANDDIATLERPVPVVAAPAMPVAEPVAAAPVAAPPVEPIVAPAAPALSKAEIKVAWSKLKQVEFQASQLKRQRVMTLDQGRDSSYFDVMRTRLLQQCRANGWTRVGLTSPGANCGKTTIALNLAFSLSRQPDQLTILADVDLRKPSLAKLLGLRSKKNFASLLEGKATFDECAVRYKKSLAIAANNTSVHNPAELLQSTVAAEALNEVQARYAPTIMLFDMPPMLAGDDVMAFVGQLDCVLIVAAAESTTIKQIDVCERDLASQTNVLGVILNKCRYMSTDEDYGYYE
ncbi:MAG: CpsD/CapB family tyrosine-protein kinase [Rhodobacteraceae bacterium]|nr:CpsD/CapB family tyrosine-protein kinase [Paracoccaceae bacterium]